MQPFAAAHVNDRRIGNRHCDGADRTGWLIVKNRLPGSPIIDRFEDATIDLRHVKDIWLRGNASDCTSPTAAEWSDVAPSQRAVQTHVGEQRARCDGGKQYRQTTNKKSCSWHMGAESSAALCWSARRRTTLASGYVEPTARRGVAPPGHELMRNRRSAVGGQT